MSASRSTSHAPLLVAALAAAIACGGEERGGERLSPPVSAMRPVVRTSDLQAGAPLPVPAGINPYEADAAAVGEGKRLYGWFNCTGCHGAVGGGGIGPPFADTEWIYGAAPENIYQSIVQGRPDGMPSFGGKIPEDELWKIVAYVRTLGRLAGAGAQSLERQQQEDARRERTGTSDGRGGGE